MGEKPPAGLFRGSLFWIPFLVLTGAFLGWQFLSLVPRWLENAAKEAVLEEGVVLTALPLEDVGLARSRFGEGALVRDAMVFQWQTLWVDYRLRDLLAGRLHILSLEEAELTVRLPFVSALVSEPASPVPAQGEAPAAPVPGVAEPPPPAVEEAPPPAPRAGIREPASLWRQLQDLPLNGLLVPDGVFKILIQDEELARSGLKAHLDRQPYGVSGELALEDGDSAAHLSLRAPLDDPMVTLQGQAFLTPGTFNGLSRRFDTLVQDRYPRLTSSGPILLDFFMDLPGDGLPCGSAQLSAEDILLELPGEGPSIGFRDVIVAGVYLNNRFKLDGGLNILPPGLHGLAASPFGLRFTWGSGAGISLETEEVTWEWGPYAGKAGFRASAFRPEMPPVRMEASFSTVTGPDLEVLPFSVLLEGQAEQLSLEISPLGLHRSGYLWFEEAGFDWNAAAKTGSGGLVWFDGIGRSMGSLALTLGAGGGSMEADLFLSGPDGSRLLSGSFLRQENRLEMDLGGRISMQWLKALNDWSGLVPGSLRGPDPGLHLDLAGAWPVFRGGLELILDKVTLELDNGSVLEEIEGTTRLAMNGLPRTDGVQQLRSAGLKSGRFTLKDLLLEWTMPTIRNLEVRTLGGKTGGGSIRLDPFSVDPLNPQFQTRLHMRAVDAGQLLDWLGEERIQLEGKLSGWFSVGWEAGFLTIGEGRLSMDADPENRRLVFSDPDFLREKISSMEGISPDIRQRFLDTLLEKGVRIDSMAASFGAAPEPGHVLLRISISGESSGEQLELPIREFVINNVISAEDLAHLLGLLGNLRVRTDAVD